MPKSMCSGCKYWEFAERGFGDSGFHYCAKLQTDSLLERKEFCGGKYKEAKMSRHNEDIAACTDKYCRLKNTCLRYHLALNHDTYQTYADFSGCRGEFYIKND